jgi:hypothetical protein
MVSFYNAEEMKKGCFIAVISKYRWYKVPFVKWIIIVKRFLPQIKMIYVD